MLGWQCDGTGFLSFSFPDSDGQDPHGMVKNVPAAADQSDTFLRTGVIQWYCDGPCDPN
jgi:hypothetical protein